MPSRSARMGCRLSRSSSGWNALYGSGFMVMPRRDLGEGHSAGRGRTLAQRLAYDALRIGVRMVGTWLYGLRIDGREHWPAMGGGLVCANHQSMLDPPLVGLTCPRQMNYLARDTLFRVPI